MGLMFPRDLEAWQRWNRPGPLRRAVSAARRRSPAAPPDGLVVVGAARPRVLVALDSANTSSQHALVAPARRLPVEEVLWLGTAEVLAAAGVLTAQETASSWPLQEGRLSGVERVLMAGSYLPAGQAAWQRARGLGCEVVVVQHGLLTPLAPPLPPEATLMAFNEQDGQFWASGRPDVTVVPVGSQAMWAAACKTSRPAADEASFVFLGQMHGRELPKREIVGQTLGFMGAHPHAVYRPHPSERDVLSRTIHRAMRRRGVQFQDPSMPLVQSESDVVSVFSTGVLEAAQRGRRAWVHHDDPPPWLVEFWDRYGLARWGQEPTRPVRWAETEPARAVADYLRGGTP